MKLVFIRSTPGGGDQSNDKDFEEKLLELVGCSDLYVNVRRGHLYCNICGYSAAEEILAGKNVIGPTVLADVIFPCNTDIYVVPLISYHYLKTHNHVFPENFIRAMKDVKLNVLDYKKTKIDFEKLQMQDFDI